MAPRRSSASRIRVSGSLKKYHAKRDFAQTPEPRGRRANVAQRLRFVVQKHRASRLHFDFRLEAGGTLASWAIPKGPSLDPSDKRLAMHVEDHPLDYRDFEGNIPKGQYGGGAVIVWDRGTYSLVEGTDPAKEIARGKIKFILHGKKLRGEFTLVRIRGRQDDSGDPWLLFKDKDEYVDHKFNALADDTSVKSKKTLDQVANDPRARTWQSKPSGRSLRQPQGRLRASPQPKPVPARRDPLPRNVVPMLATLVEEPFDDEDWLFEIKWDGYRAICTVNPDGKLSLLSRNGRNLLQQFPDLSGLADSFASLPIVVDGEIVSLDSSGRASFQRLQEYMQRGGRLTFAAFDLLYADGRDLRSRPLEERKTALSRLIRDGRSAIYSKHVIGEGKALYKQAKRRHLEGIIGKKRASVYQQRRSRDWVKIKTGHEQEFVVGGWTEPKGSRSGFGSLLLGVYAGKNLRFVGSVGTGFNTKLLADIARKLRALERSTSPFVNPVIANATVHYAKPQLVAQVRFAEWTRDEYLRQPAFLGLRTDKDPKDVVRE